MSTYTQQNHTVPLARSSSFFGTIKNIVTAPFTWFAGSDDEFEDTKGKRRRLPVASEDVFMEDECVPSRAKRMRVSSPAKDIQPYLDPPRSAFPQPRRTSDLSTSGSLRGVSRSPRKMLHLPSASSTSNLLPRNRRTVSPLPSSSYLKSQGMTRTMSLDPPSHSSFSSHIQPTSTIQDLQSEANPTRNSVTAGQDISMSPRRLRVRSSLTPQPSGTGFGPVVPPRRERGPDEPPPLSALMSNPMFVKPPPGVQKQSTAESQMQLTLGTLIDSQRSTRAPARQSSILFGTGSMTDVSARHLWPVNKAELALQELEVYKIPLLPTRLKGATAVPDMFMHKEKKLVTLMTDDRPVKPRLGTKSKPKEKSKGKKDRDAVNGTKPYAGEGGMKKWLARRKKEEEEAKEKERAEAMEDERAEEERQRKEAEAERKREEDLTVPPPVFEPQVSREGASNSSLRVGRTRIGRNHIEHPISRRAKFSAAFEYEDEDMEESRAAEHKALEEAAKKAPVFELPASFTFAKEITITHDLAHAKEPPITSLPFSLTETGPVPAPAPASTPSVETVKAAPIATSSTPVPELPKISLIPPTPETVKVAPEAPTIPTTVAPTTKVAATSAGIPIFFPNSSVFAKSTAGTTLPSSSLTLPRTEQPKPIQGSVSSVTKTVDVTPSPFGVLSQPTLAVAIPSPNSAAASSMSAPTLPKEAEKPPTVAPSPVPLSTLGAPIKPVEPVSVPIPISNLSSKQPPAEPANPTAASNALPAVFVAPPLVPPAAPVATPTPGATVEASKGIFTFGQPVPAAAPTSTPASVTAPSATDASKSLFGTPPPATPFSFGQRPSTVSAEGKPATTAFSFGTSATEKKPVTGFTFSSSTASTAAPAAPATFSFGAAPSGTTVADAPSKPFAFGSTTSARPVTPPKTVQEVTMDESPVRDMILNGNGKAERPTLNFSFNPPSGSALFAQSPATTTAPFSFGAAGATVNPFAKEEKKETKPAVSFTGFGQAPSTGFSFGQKPPESPATTTPAPAPFQFAQPSPSAAPASPFAFGAAPTSPNPFGQPSTASAPSSPSTFNRPTPFSFGTPTATQPAASSFAFGTGSQPASPAAGSTTLPSGTAGSTPFTFGAGTGTGTAPGVAFGGTTPAAAPAGGSLFTMGSAPPPVDLAGARRIKGLPRRGARR